MKIAILATNPHLYSHKRLKAEGEAAGHRLKLLTHYIVI